MAELLTKKIPCAGPGCANRRVHHERPDEPRGVQMVEVPESYDGNATVYCSIECWLYHQAKVNEKS